MGLQKGSVDQKLEGVVRLETAPNFVEFLIIEAALSGLPSAGDIRVEVKVQIDGFVGSGSCWIEEPTLRAFSAVTSNARRGK